MKECTRWYEGKTKSEGSFGMKNSALEVKNSHSQTQISLKISVVSLRWRNPVDREIDQRPTTLEVECRHQR